MAHTNNRALFRDDIMQCFAKKWGESFLFIPPMGNVSYTLQQITALRQKKLFVTVWC